MLRLLMFLLIWLSACAKKGSGGYGYDYYAEEAPYAAMDEADDYGGMAYGRSAGASYKEKRAESYAMAPPPAPAMEEPMEPVPQPVPSSSPTPQPAQQRMVHYSGWANLRVARSDEAADAIEAIAVQVEGFVEARSNSFVTIRVPAEHFHDVMDKVLAIGDVLGKQISAQDITDAFAAVELRLKTAQTTHDRLVVLLAQTTDEQEKLRLVREIQRLTEEIDRLSGQKRTLDRLASYSRITVELVAREALAHTGGEDETLEFGWIRQLSPFYRDFVSYSKGPTLPVPEGMVALDEKKVFIAESAEGAKVWTGRIENEPEGDAAFWIEAIAGRLGDDFAATEQVDMGSFKTLRLVDRSDEPYTWIIGVRVSGKWLEIVEIYYPTAQAEERYRAAVEAAVGGGAS